jgi:cyclopropane fatty-acyl-phospholipid synthase-like methyltransferase
VYPKIRTLEDAKKTICIRKGPFRPDEDLCQLPLKDISWLLDFGCGVGRNLEYFLRNSSAGLYAYDFPNMTDLAKTYMKPLDYPTVIWLNPPLENILKYRYDLITVILVFQHMREKALRETLPVLAKALTQDGLMYVHTNSTMNEGSKWVWSILLDYFSFVSFVQPSSVPRKWKDTPLVNDINKYHKHTHQKVLLKVK